MKTSTKIRIRVRELAMIARRLPGTRHPMLAHVVLRRCNLACTYRNEDDGVSSPVPLADYCSRQRGYPNIPIARSTRDDLRREFFTPKTCAPQRTVACVNIMGLFDNWRAPQTIEPYRVGQADPRQVES